MWGKDTHTYFSHKFLMDYTIISKEYEELYEKKLQDPLGSPNYAKIKSQSKSDPTIFARWYLGIKPFHYQDQVLNDDSKRIAICSSRQIGKTYVVAIKALHYAMFNPESEVLIFSKSIGQAKKFMRFMKKLIYQGQEFVAKQLDKQSYAEKDPAYVFPVDIDTKAPNNNEEFSLTNGTVIRSLPPTDSSRGYTGNLVIVDEAAFVKDDIYNEVIAPTTRFTNGTVILLSTPKGQAGFFYHIFDPEDKHATTDWKRYWWNWEICPEPSVRKVTESERERLVRAGEELKYRQEYEAQFTADADSFFQPRKVREAIDERLDCPYQDLEHDYYCGIDYGVHKSRTVISLVTHNKDTDNINLIYQMEFPADYDNGQLIPFLIGLETRFRIVEYIVDDCPQGDVINKKLIQIGKKVYLFNFTREKESTYFRFKVFLNRRHDEEGPRIRIPNIKELIQQMNAMQQTPNRRGYTSIAKPIGGRDDRVDSLILACYSLIKEDVQEFKAILI